MDNNCKHEVLFYLGERNEKGTLCRCLDCNKKDYFNEEENKGNIIYYATINDKFENIVLEKYNNLKNKCYSKKEIVGIIQGDYNGWLMQHMEYIEGYSDDDLYKDDTILLKRTFK